MSVDNINLCTNQLSNLIEHEFRDWGAIPELSILCQALYENNSDECEDKFRDVNHYELARHLLLLAQHYATQLHSGSSDCQ